MTRAELESLALPRDIAERAKRRIERDEDDRESSDWYAFERAAKVERARRRENARRFDHGAE